MGDFPGFPPAAVVNNAAAPTAPAESNAGGPAPASNPFAAAASANPFAAAAGANPFAASFKPATVFKPKDPRAIMDDDDDAPFDFAAGGKKPKKKTQAELEAEKKRAKEAEDAKLSFKGKPSDFFIMDYIPGDPRDPTGNFRVPTQDQSIFIFTHYPTEAQPHAMILKLYQLYQDAALHEEKERKIQEARNSAY